MEYIVPGICGLLVLIGLVAIVMSRRTWRIPQMILVFFVLVFSLTFFYLAARTLRTRQNWEDTLTDYRKKIKVVENGDPSAGEAAPKGIVQLTKERTELQQQVAKAMAERGRVWHDAIRNRVDGATGVISATFDQWPPQGLDAKAVVFVFEENDKEKGGQYLGEFTVLSVDATNKELKMAPSSTMVQRELNLIGNSKGPWALYEVMPGDSHALYADLDPNALKNLLPTPTAGQMSEVVAKWYANETERYLRDQTEVKDADLTNDNLKDGIRVLVKFTKEWSDNAAAPAAPVAAAPAAGAAAAPADNAGNGAAGAKPGDEKSFKPGDVVYLSVDKAKELVDAKVAEYDTSEPADPETGKPRKPKIYVRPLNDYASLFRETYRRRNELFASQAEVKAQADQVEAANAQLTLDITAANDEKKGLTSDLTKFKAELESVVTFNKALDDKLTKTRAALSELFRANIRLSAQLTDVEKQIVDAIHRQTPPAETSASVGR